MHVLALTNAEHHRAWHHSRQLVDLPAAGRREPLVNLSLGKAQHMAKLSCLQQPAYINITVITYMLAHNMSQPCYRSSEVLTLTLVQSLIVYQHYTHLCGAYCAVLAMLSAMPMRAAG